MKCKWIILLIFLPFLFSCRQQVNDELIVSSPNLKVPIVVYFKKDTNHEQVNDFIDNVIGYPHPEGKGHYNMKGIIGLFTVINQDYKGVAINEIDENERQSILKAINSSSLVYRVFENVVPNEIILDEAKAKKEKEDLEKSKKDNRPKKEVVITNSSESK